MLITEANMSDREKSKEQLIEELASLRREVAALKTTKTAFDAQNELLRNLVTMMRTATGSLMLRAMLQQTLQMANRLTNAEEGSLFLLDANGTVIESILARGVIIRENKQSLIGKIMDKGLAGWVIRHRQVGLIADTMNDERWLTLPGEPYTVRSALCVPILRGKMLLGSITLMHSQPEHFTTESANLMRMTAEQIALVIDNAQLYIEHQQPPETEPCKPDQDSHQDLHKTEGQLLKQEELSLLGIYIIKEGKFLYANPRLAEIFGYTFAELISLKSVYALVARDQRKFVAYQIHQCLEGQSKNLLCTFPGKRQDGSLINVEFYGIKTKFYGKSVLIGVLRSA